jgi:uncharacterized SAM-binding protein YcdF (DUF218 family)
VEPPPGRPAQGAGAGRRRALSLDDDARLVWDYHHVGHTLAPADCIIALGSHDTRVAERAADLFLQGWAPLLVLSGHLGSLTSGMWTRPEAEVFADVAAARGVPRERMLLETQATNTGENVACSRALLEARGLRPRRAIAVQKPYMERRTLATFQRRWPELEVVVTSPQVAFDDYPASGITRDDVIHIMVGDLQRLIVYAEKGWSTPQEVPARVRAAFDRLVAAGYTGRLL